MLVDGHESDVGWLLLLLIVLLIVLLLLLLLLLVVLGHDARREHHLALPVTLHPSRSRHRTVSHPGGRQQSVALSEVLQVLVHVELVLR